MENESSSITLPEENTASYKGKCNIEGERGNMMTESKLDYIESLIKRAKSFTHKNPLADSFREWRSCSISVLLAVGTLLISLYVTDSKMSNTAEIILWVILCTSILALIANWYMFNRLKKEKEEPYNSCLDETLGVFTKFRESFK